MPYLPFDQPYYLAINHARWAAAHSIIESLRSQQIGGSLASCLDVACGPGWFTERLLQVGLDVVGMEGRSELVEEATHRVKGASFRCVDVESQAEMSQLGAYDLVFCFGLLYHVENPYRVIRNLEQVTGQVLLLETMVYPSDEMTLRLVAEGQYLDQGLTYQAVVASKPSLVSMLKSAGFSWVAQYRGQIDHPDFVENDVQHARRVVLLAARSPLSVPEFEAVSAPDAPMFEVAKVAASTPAPAAATSTAPASTPSLVPAASHQLVATPASASADVPPPPATIHVIGASIPRSGHHYMVRLLEAALGDRFFYCWSYGVMGCCRETPCAFWGRRPVSFQKSHDLELTLPRDVPGAVYLIQHRLPVPVALSAREFYAREEYDESYGRAVASDRGEYAVWLGRLAAYYIGFHERWLSAPSARSVVVDYDDLSAYPGEALRRVLADIDVDVTEDEIESAVTQIVGRGGPFGEQQYAPRPIEARPYYDHDLLATFESLVVAHLPHLAARRSLPAVEYGGTLIQQIFQARRSWQQGDPSRSLATVERALTDHRENALLLHERSAYLQALGRHDEARAALQEAALLSPPHPEILTALMTVSLELGDVVVGREAARALVQLMGAERAGPVAAGLADGDGPVQGMSSGQERNGGLNTEADRLRFLRGEVATREVALRRAELALVEKERVIRTLAHAADERLKLIEQLDAAAAELRAALERAHSAP